MPQPVILRPDQTVAENFRVYDESLVVRLYNSLASATFKVVARVLDSSGVLRVVEQTLTTTSDRTQQVTRLRIPSGYLVSAAVIATAQTPRRGQAWAVISLESTMPDGDLALMPLAQGYVTADSALLWPGRGYGDSVEGPGILLSVAGTNPAAGAEITETVPANARWYLRALRATLVTDATVATRTVNFIIDDGTTTLVLLASAPTQAASLTYNYNVRYAGFSSGLIGTDNFIPSPFELVLFQGWRFRTSTTNLQAGDNWGAPQMEVEEWIEE